MALSIVRGPQYTHDTPTAVDYCSLHGTQHLHNVRSDVKAVSYSVSDLTSLTAIGYMLIASQVLT